MIKTKEFAFPKSIYIRILIKNSLKRSLWAFIFLIVVAAYQFTKGMSNTTLLLIALPIVYLLYIIIRCWMHTNSKINKLFFKGRVFEIDNQTIIITFNGKIASEIRIVDIARVIKNSKYYLLFMSKKKFIYVPISAFRTTGDISRFDSILKARKFQKSVSS
jgi:hypothetical protein